MRLAAALAPAAAALGVVLVLYVAQHQTPTVLDQVDKDAAAYFETSRRLSGLGDSEYALASAAMDRGKIKHALRFGIHAERAFRFSPRPSVYCW